MEESEKALREILGNRFDSLNEAIRDIIIRTPAETIKKAHAKLLDLGITPQKIATQAALLGRNPDTIQRNAKALRGLGLNPEKIATQVDLLGFNPDTIQRNARALKDLGLTPEKIATQAALLGRDPDTIQRNYMFLRRFFSKDTIVKNAQLLGNAQATVEGSIQLLHELGIDHDRYPYAYTTPRCKRKKIISLAKARSGLSRDLTKQEKMELLQKAREFVRTRPSLLRMSEKKIKAKFARAA